MHAKLRASGPKADLALVVCDVDATVAGTFTLNVMCAAPVTYCKEVLERRETVRAVRIPHTPCFVHIPHTQIEESKNHNHARLVPGVGQRRSSQRRHGRPGLCRHSRQCRGGRDCSGGAPRRCPHRVNWGHWSSHQGAHARLGCARRWCVCVSMHGGVSLCILSILPVDVRAVWTCMPTNVTKHGNTIPIA